MTTLHPQASGVDIYCAYTDIVDIETLTPHPRNYNQHPDQQIALLAKMIRARGWRNPIVVSKRSGFIIKGHARLAAAKLLNVAQAPIDKQEFADEATEYAEMIADNRIAELAEPNLPVLKDILQELDTGALDMDLTGYNAEVLANMMTQFHLGAEKAWDGLPAMEQEDQNSYRSVMVHFPNQFAVDDFCSKLGCTLTEKTKSIWYPKQSFDQHGTKEGLTYHNENES